MPGVAGGGQQFAGAALLPLLNPFALLPPKYWRAAKDPFSYTRDFTGNDAVAASVTTSRDLQINNDSDFVWVATRAVFSNTATEVVDTIVPSVTVLFKDSGAGRDLMDRATHVANVMGIALSGTSSEVGKPYWDYPKLLSGGSTLTIAFTNLIATAKHVRISLLGFKLFPFKA